VEVKILPQLQTTCKISCHLTKFWANLGKLGKNIFCTTKKLPASTYAFFNLVFQVLTVHVSPCLPLRYKKSYAQGNQGSFCGKRSVMRD